MASLAVILWLEKLKQQDKPISIAYATMMGLIMIPLPLFASAMTMKLLPLLQQLY